MSPPLTLHLPWRPAEAAAAALAREDGAVWFDSATPDDPRGNWSYLCVRPLRRVIAPADPFSALAALHATLPPQPPPAEGEPPFRGGIAGWLSYEAGRHLERLPPPRSGGLNVPEAAFGLYPAVAAFDHRRQSLSVHALPGHEAAGQALAEALAAAPQRPPLAATTGVSLAPERPATEAMAATAAVIAYIRAGDIFQANLTHRFLGHMPPGLAPFDLYRRLRRAAPAPFAAYAAFDGAFLLCASPERFLRLHPDGRVETRPIKGTRPRGLSPAEDRAQAEALAASAKDRAENLMIVDLMRNDLSRVCALGSVRVPSLCAVESFPAVHHLVSVVEGRLRPGLGAVDLLRATFPGGSITGAPKVRAMEIIAELEPAPRGLYCGSLFWLGADGGMDSSILIRTVTVGRDGQVAAQAGGGIVADSDPAGEWAEALLKAAALRRAAAG